MDIPVNAEWNGNCIEDDWTVPRVDTPGIIQSVPLWWWSPSTTPIRICAAAPIPADPGRASRLEKLKSLHPGRSCLRVTGKPPSGCNARIATCYSERINNEPRGELEFKKVYIIDDDGALSRPVIRDRVPGQSEPERLDLKSQWKIIVQGKE